MKKVSIVVPAYNAAGTLAECIEACAAQTWPDLEMIIVDDGSTDATAAIANRPGVRYFHQANRGPAAARNHGARESAGAVVAFTDADCLPHRDWIEQLMARFTDGVAGVGGTYGIGNPDSMLARLVHEEIALRHERLDGPVDFLGSFNVAYRRDAFERAGGFDESFRIASGEDNDLAYRIEDAGNQLIFTRDAVVDHYHPERLGPYLRSQMHHGFWRMKLYAKHPGRSRGDRYAGAGDLAAPPLAVAAAGSACLALLFLPWPTIAAFAGGTSFALLCMQAVPHTGKAVRMMGRLGPGQGLAFLPLAMARDYARAAGMLRGAVHFLLCRKAGV